jgi:hypothetical protein
MNTKYRYKPLEIDAVQFQATPEGIAAMALFGAGDFTGVNLNGHPLPAAFVAGLVIPEGSWLVRNASGMYKVLKDSVFTAVCERAPAAVEVVIEAVAQAVTDGAGVELQDPREAAMIAGAKRFMPAEPCKHGHMAERYVSNNCCVVCTGEHVRASRKRTKRLARMREYSREYYQRKRAEQQAESASSACVGIFAPLAASLAHNMSA